MLDDLLDQATDGAAQNDVTFEVTIDGVAGDLFVREVSFTEPMNGLPVAIVHALGDGAPPPGRDLLRKNCTVKVQRPGYLRHFHGIVWQARVHDAIEGHVLVLRIASAVQLLDQIVDTYMYQDESVPQIVKTVVERYLGGVHRKVSIDHLRRTYPDHEYVLQYQESVFRFVSRICEDAGIFFFFDHDAEGEDHEVLVLADHPLSLPKARARDGGSVSYLGDRDPPPGEEVVTHVEHVEEVGATDVVVAGYDWTHTDLTLRKEKTGRGASDPALEIYDHSDAVAIYDYQEPQYRANDAGDQGEIRAELLDVSRQHWLLQSTVLTAQPGYLLSLTGAPQDHLDQQYLITGANSAGQVVAGGMGVWHSSLECVPTSLPFRPGRTTPRPSIQGPETAVVVGPTGSDEIYTDQHGRVKVQFHWDRQHQRNEESSCWIRVAHNWAGSRFGTFFLPRIGMEVLVSFLGGNPNRPLVTGCVYNGSNHVPHLNLPQEKTQTVIRSQSTGPGGAGSGYNELRFEDLDGQEFVSVHAQRDLREKVLRNRTTEIHNDDQLTVTRNATTRIRGRETHFVHRDARWTYLAEISWRINRRKTDVGFVDDGEAPGDYYVNCTERVTAFGETFDDPSWKDTSNFDGRLTEFTSLSGWLMTFEHGTFELNCPPDPPTKFKYSALDGYIDLGGRNRVMMVAGSSPAALSGVKVEPDKVLMKSPGEIKAEITNGLASIEMSANSILFRVGPTELVLHPAGITINAPIFQQSGNVTLAMATVVSRGGKPIWD